MGRIVGGTSDLTVKDRGAVLQALKGLDVFRLLVPLLEQAEEADRTLGEYTDMLASLTRSIEQASKELGTLEGKVATVRQDYLQKQAEAEAETRRPLAAVQAEVTAKTKALRDEADSFEKVHQEKLTRWKAEAEAARESHEGRKAELREEIADLKMAVVSLTAQRDDLLAAIDAIRQKVA